MAVSSPNEAYGYEELDRLERMHDCRSAIAAPAALVICRRYGLTPPSWVVDAAAEQLGRFVRGQSAGKSGHSGSPAGRYRQDQIDYVRWEVVREVREKQKAISQQIRELRSLKPLPTGILRKREKLQRWVGKTWLRAFECAAAMLKEFHPACAAGPEAVKQSYMKVQQAHGLAGARYHLIDAETRKHLALADPANEPDPNGRKDQDRGKILRPLYDLTI